MDFNGCVVGDVRMVVVRLSLPGYWLFTISLRVGVLITTISERIREHNYNHLPRNMEALVRNNESDVVYVLDK